MLSVKQKNTTALFTAILFHACGFIGILFTPYKNWFIQNTAINLLLMCILLVWTQQQKNKAFFFFFVICYTAGMIAEILGTNTGLVFGKYQYGNVLGAKIFNVPFIIGINWFIIIYCTGVIVEKFDRIILKKMGSSEAFTSKMLIVSFLVDASLLAAFFDWVLEPVAIKLNFWHWLGDGKIPLYNYSCWLIISAVLLIAFRSFKFSKDNQFAVHLFIIQLLFFIALRTFL